MVFHELFWATFLILLGVSLILKAFLGIHIPVVKVFFAVFLIYLGASILLKKPQIKKFHDWKTKSSSMRRQDGEYVNVFGKQYIDFSSIKPEKNTMVEVTVVFGKSIIRINPDVPTKIEVSGAFSNVKMPSEKYGSSLMGKDVFTTVNFDEEKDYLYIQASAVFSSLEFVTE